MSRRTLRLLLQGAVIVLAVAVAAIRFAAIDAGSHSASDTLRPWLIEVAGIAVLAAALVIAIGRVGKSDRTDGS
jgi:hypothetical protein